MPFVQRTIEPKHLSRTSLADADGKPLVDDGELEAVANNTLCNALRQLASLVLAADDIFRELRRDLEHLTARGDKLKVRIRSLDAKVADYDPKKVSVPVSDIANFALLKNHYHIEHPLTTGLFERATRPKAVKDLYDAAAKTPVHLMRQLDRWRRDGHRSSRFFMCTPILGGRKRRIRSKVDIDIETRMPALVEDLRKWTSTEALGDVTVMTDGLRIRRDLSANGRIDPIAEGDLTDGTIISDDDEGIDHQLPSPEEQVHVVALKFPAEIVTVDVSGRRFDRMSGMRRSLMTAGVAADGSGGGNGGGCTQPEDGSTVRRRTKTRKPRNRRRNTLAGTDQKEIRDALTGVDDPSNSEVQTDSAESPSNAPIVGRSKSSDLLRRRDVSESGKKSHFNTLKQWGKKMIANYTEKSERSPSLDKSIEEDHQYETVTLKRKRNIDKERKSMHERKPSCSSSDKSSISIPINTPLATAVNISSVKLRDSSAQRRLRRTGGNKDEPHSSSGNWSASSESGRASIGSEITSTTQPKSSSAATSSNSLNLHPPSSVNSRRRYINTSASGSVTSEGTLTPDIIHDLHEDGETSSVYSCDTEGYYTSFHMDSGLKTLKEEDSPVTPLHSTSTFTSSSSNTAENEYELFGKGSTSTTTSSAGTVCTTLRAAESERSLVLGPAVPERKSSLTKLSSKSKSPESSLERDYSSEKTGTVKRSPASTAKTVVQIHKDSNSDGDVSPDSGHNTSSSPIESINSPNGIRSGSEFEYSESSDMEGPDRIERIRVKTTINSSRIPSMCVITPNQSDDDCSVKSNQFEEYRVNNNMHQLESNSSENNNNVESGKKNKIQVININPQTGYATIETKIGETAPEKTSLRSASPSGGSMIVKDSSAANNSSIQSKNSQPILKATLLPLNNMLGKLKLNLSAFGSRTSKSPVAENIEAGDAGEYVTIADVRNNNEKYNAIYANDVVNRNLTTVLSGKIRETEYISLNELPCNEGSEVQTATADSLERRRRGARVTLNSEGRVIYSSDSLKRRRGAHTTFEPGPFVKAHSPVQSPLPTRASCNLGSNATSNSKKTDDSQPSSQQLGKVVIKANNSASEIVRMPPSTIVAPTNTTTPMSPTKQFNTTRGAYVNVLNEGRALSPSSNQPHAADARQQPSYDYYAYNNQVFGANNMHFENGYNRPNMYSTLPSRKPQYASRVLPERSVTPDIMRGLANIEYNSLDRKDRRHFDGLQEYQGRTNFTQDEFEGFVEYPPPPTPQRLHEEMQMMQQQHQHQQEVFLPPPPTQPPTMNLGIPVQIPQVNMYNLRSPHVPHNYYHFESPKRDSPSDTSFLVSPIDPRHRPLNGGGMKSSTPAKVHELKSAANLESRLSPKKSSMTNEELYAVIHKTKKKMNIQSEDLDRPSPSLSPVSSESSMTSNRSCNRPETGYLDKSKSRLSWSPNGDYMDFNTNIDKIPPAESRSRQSWACTTDINTATSKKESQTSRLDFKRLLLMHGKQKFAQSSKKLSAVEQLKLSKQNIEHQPKNKEDPNVSILDLSQSPRNMRNRKFVPPGSPNKNEKRSVPKLLSPRSQWRFANPRSDVLSSTIPEDCQEDENHSKSSNGELRETTMKLTNSPRSSPKYSPQLDASNQCNDISRSSDATNNKGEMPSFKDIKQKFERDLPKLPPMTATQRLQAQRAQFFSNAPKSTANTSSRYDSVNKQSINPAQASIAKNERIPSPTLETSF